MVLNSEIFVPVVSAQSLCMLEDNIGCSARASHDRKPGVENSGANPLSRHASRFQSNQLASEVLELDRLNMVDITR